jgi:hypothetical protein
VSKLTQNEAMALRAWIDTDEDFDVLSFAAIHRRSQLPKHLVRRTVRAMGRKGVTQFVRGCWNEDGEPTGSGYGLTETGRALMREIPERQP